MIIDKDKITTQDELDEPAPIEQADARVKAKMKQLRGKAKKDVAEGLRDRRVTKDRTVSKQSKSKNS